MTPEVSQNPQGSPNGSAQPGANGHGTAVDPAKLPSIGIVTASLNRLHYLEDAMKSVLDQNYPKLRYAVVDGGSTDGSVEVIKKYADRLAYWCSEKDNGHFHALNKGFAQLGDVDVMGFINSDDMYCPWAFSVVGEIFAKFPQIEWLTTLFPIIWDAKGRATHCKRIEGFSKEGFWRGENLPGNNGSYSTWWIQQESTFWRRGLWEKAGGRMDDSLRIAGDFELWARFYQHADLYGVATPLAGFRYHGDQFTGQQMGKYMNICRDILARHGGRPYGKFGSWLRGGRLSRWIPDRVKRATRLRHPRKQVVYQIFGGGWALKDA